MQSNNSSIFFLADNVTKVGIEPKNIVMNALLDNTLVLILSALGFVIVVGVILSILLSQRLHKRHRGYNPTDNQVCLIFDCDYSKEKIFYILIH